ncbi:MAG: hypothetical protein WCE46_06820 [Methanoregula sp.]|uniref:hypothetical protein n=1 Tax=Methanoregula sp. TaxID=2052170 RepID=UPI003C78E30C
MPCKEERDDTEDGGKEKCCLETARERRYRDRERIDIPGDSQPLKQDLGNWDLEDHPHQDDAVVARRVHDTGCSARFRKSAVCCPGNKNQNT